MARLSLFTRKLPPPPVRALPPSERIYAIGDIHGRSDCLDTLIAAIDADDAARGPARTTVVFLGDLTDRGPDSKGVIERLIGYEKTRRCVFLMGNHEEVLINAWEGDDSSTRLFHRIGGRATMLSYGMNAVDYDTADIAELTALIGDHVPMAHIAFLRRFEDYHRAGDYLFVHAGIKPGVEIERQSPIDMRWIRDKFLDDTREHGALVVHGHSIAPGVDENPNRVGIDTGAYDSGVLTAIGIEGTQRWYLSS